MRVTRKRVLETAKKVMDMYAGSRAVLELEFFDEAGTGLGPTLEFYTLLAHELQKKELGMWRHDDMGGNKFQGSGKRRSGHPSIWADLLSDVSHTYEVYFFCCS